MPTLKEAFLGTEKQNKDAQEMIDRYNRSKRISNAAQSWTTNLENEGSSDAINIDTYGKPKSSKQVESSKFVGKALDEADAEKAREHTRGAKGMKKGGKVSSASSRADGIAQRGKTKGRMV